MRYNRKSLLVETNNIVNYPMEPNNLLKKINKMFKWLILILQLSMILKEVILAIINTYMNNLLLSRDSRLKIILHLIPINIKT